ncbi:hypothetical protein [Blastococcus sp. SYSU D00820]
MSTARPGAALSAVALAATLLLTACGSDEPADPPSSAEGGSGDGTIADPSGAFENPGSAPEECAEAFPLAQGGDIADVESVPADFPEPPDGAVLCETGGTVRGGQEYVSYAADLSGEEVLAYYEANGPGAERIDSGLGEAVTGTSGDVIWQVDPQDGGFRVVFQAA